MAIKLLLICFICVKAATAQYYAPSYYPYSNYYNYYPPTTQIPTLPYPTPQLNPPNLNLQIPSLSYPPTQIPPPQTPTLPYPPSQISPPPISTKFPPSQYYSTPKLLPQTYPAPQSLPQSYPYPQFKVKSTPNYAQPTPSYYVNTPKEQTQVKVVQETKLQHKCPPSYNCPLCNGYKDVVPNSKVPPPPKNSPLLPDLLEKISTIEKEVENEKKTLLSKLKDVCEKPGLKKFKEKLLEKPKSYRFDQDLLDGFLTGLGLSD